MPENRGGKPAEPAVVAANEAIRRRFPFDDTRDLHDARRGFLGTAGENLVRAADGRVVWDLDAYGFLARDRIPASSKSANSEIDSKFAHQLHH
ncbi:hypothetical protein [Streptomyces youssoufiensis]